MYCGVSLKNIQKTKNFYKKAEKKGMRSMRYKDIPKLIKKNYVKHNREIKLQKE